MSSSRKFVGMIVATIFSLSYLLAPIYILSSLVFLAIFFGKYSIIYSIPLFVSILLPSTAMPFIIQSSIFRCLLDYFDYEEVFEIEDEKFLKLLEEAKNTKRSYILTSTPHGIVSFGGMCAAAAADPRYASLVTAVAGAVLKTPILKHVIGIFGLIDASSKSLIKHMKKGGLEGSFVLYIGGIAELFKCSLEEERLFLKERKGFIKLALKEGADVIPVYFFGNTSVLSIPRSSLLEAFSRRMQMSLIIFWGRWGLPIPRPNKILYVRGKPLGLPRIPEPSDEDVSRWHAVYIQEVQRIFDTYKHRVPEYKDKSLIID